MNKFVVFATIITVAAALPAISPEVAARRALPAVEHSEIRDDLGQYEFRFVTAEGTIVHERGRLVPNAEGTGFVLVTEGDTTLIGDDGKVYTSKWSAGLDGMKIEGDHLPVPVTPEPVPKAETAAVPVEPQFESVRAITVAV